MNGHTWLAERARTAPEAPCFLGSEPASWAEAWARLQAARATFAPYQGRVVAFALEDGPEAALALVGCAMSGAIAFPLPPQATAHERERLLANLDVALVVEHGELPAIGAPVEDYPAAGDIAMLVATSGSTGTPKRVALTYGGLWWNGRTHAESLGLSADTRTLITSPLYHAFPLVALLFGTLAVGGAVDFLGGGFTPRGLLKRVAASDISYVALSPTALRLLIERDRPEFTLPSVLSVGAGPMPAAELAAAGRWAQSRGAVLFHTYGLSEAGPRVATLSPHDLLNGHEASVGRSMPGVEVRIVGEEVWLRSPSVMAGYYPEGGGLEADGWLATGDRGRLDAEGFLILEGRLKDVIVTGGVTVSAREVEEALLADPRVVEAAVVGVADSVYGEVGRAFVVTRTPVTAQELLGHLAGLLSRHKLPHRIELVAALPRTALGKVDKGRLKEAACGA